MVGGRHAGFKINTDHDGAGGEFTVKSSPAIEKEQQKSCTTRKKSMEQILCIDVEKK